MKLSPFSITFWMRILPDGVSLSAAVIRARHCSEWGMVPVLGPCVRMCWHFLQIFVY